MTESKEGALSRWSRLKREARSTEQPGEDSAIHTGGTGASGAKAEPTTGEAPVETVSAPGADAVKTAETEPLPDIETLNYESDFSVFMRETVPEEVRRLALRKLWRTDPLLANVDGLNDYDLDYTFSEFVQIATESAEDLRRGTKRQSTHDLRREAREQERKLGQERAQTQQQRRKGPRGKTQERETAAAHADAQASREAGSAGEQPSESSTGTQEGTA